MSQMPSSSGLPGFDPCSELGSTIAKIAMLHASEKPHVKTINDVVAEMQKGFPEITRREVVESLNEAHGGRKQSASELKSKLSAIKREARADANLRKTIQKYGHHLEAGTLPEGVTPRSDNSPETIKALRMIAADLRKQIRGSDPAVREKLAKQIDTLREKIERGVGIPTPRERPTLSKENERLAYEVDRLQKAIKAEIERARPQDWKIKTGRIGGEVLNFPRAMMAGWDLGLSWVRRQNVFYGSAHPIRTAAAAGRSVRGALSDRYYFKRMQKILDRPNAYLDKKMGLEFSDLSGSLSKREENVNSLLTEKIRNKAKLLPSSGRGMTLGLNEIRASMADTYLSTLTRRSGEATAEELKWIGSFVNSATGRGNIYGFEKSAAALNTFFFSPRLNTSRAELLIHKGLFTAPTWRTRRIAAEEYARFYVGAAAFMGLAAAGYKSLGLEVSFETDPKSSDFFKLKIGDHIRIDMSGGLFQLLILEERLRQGKTKTLGGKIVPIRGEDVPFKGDRAWDLLADYGRKKLAPVPGAVVDMLSGENVIGEPVTPGSAAKQLVTPLLLRDIKSIMQENGWKGLPMELQNLIGDGVQYYEDRKKSGSRPREQSPPPKR